MSNFIVNADLSQSDLISIAAFIVSLLAVLYSRTTSLETRRTNSLAFRTEWLAAYKTMCRAHASLTLPVGPFACFSESVKRGYPLALDGDLLSQLKDVEFQARLWSDSNVQDLIQKALMWNDQLALDFNNTEEDIGNAELHAQQVREKASYGDEARKNLGLAIDIVRAKLCESAP